jgi:hypothetical protein
MMRQSTPYALAGLGLVSGLTVLLFGPFSIPEVNYVVGGTFLAIAVASVTYMIVEFSGPDERPPDF